jgi:hypothetical protein
VTVWIPPEWARSRTEVPPPDPPSDPPPTDNPQPEPNAPTSPRAAASPPREESAGAATDAAAVAAESVVPAPRRGDAEAAGSGWAGPDRPQVESGAAEVAPIESRHLRAGEAGPGRGPLGEAGAHRVDAGGSHHGAAGEAPWPWFAVRGEVHQDGDMEAEEAEGGSGSGLDLDQPTAILPTLRPQPDAPAPPSGDALMRADLPPGEDEDRRSGGAGDGLPDDGDGGGGAGSVDWSGGPGTSGGSASSAPADAPVSGGAAPLPRRVPQTPPPPFGVVGSPGGASLFEPPHRGSATSQLRAAAHLPPESPPRDRADVSGLWAGAAAARGEQHPAPTEPVSDLWQPKRSRDAARRSSAPAEPTSRVEPTGMDRRWGHGDDQRPGRAEPSWDEVVASLDTRRAAPSAPTPSHASDPQVGWTVVDPFDDSRASVGRPAAPAERPGPDEGWATGAPSWDGDDDVVGAPGRHGRENRREESGRTGRGWADSPDPGRAPPADTADRTGWAAVGDQTNGDGAPQRSTAGHATARPARTPYEEDPTEVIGPFDIGRWTLQGRTGLPADPAAARIPARPSTGTRDVRDRGVAERDRGERPRGGAGPVRASGGGREGGPPRGGPPRARSTPGGPGRPSPRGGRVRTVIRGIAQTCITLGLVLLLFSVYEVWFTGLMNGRTQDRLKNALEKEWEGAGDDPVVAAQRPARPGAKVRSIPLGDGFALI